MHFGVEVACVSRIKKKCFNYYKKVLSVQIKEVVTRKLTRFEVLKKCFFFFSPFFTRKQRRSQENGFLDKCWK